MTALDIKMTADPSPVIAALDKIGSKLGDMQAKFAKAFGSMDDAAKRLGGTLAVLGVATAAFADEITDLAAAHEMSIGTILAMNEALGQNGGKAENAGKMIQSLANKISDANGGNMKVAESFDKLGVSMADLGSKSQTEIQDKLLSSLAAIKDPTERNAKAFELFGKALVGVNIKQYAEDQKKNREEMEKYAGPLLAAGAAFDKIANLMEKLKIAFAVAFKPLFDAIRDINPSIGELTEALKLAGAAVAFFASAAILASIGKMATAFGLVNTVLLANPLVRVASLVLAAGTAVAAYWQLNKKGSKDAEDAAAAKALKDAENAADRKRAQDGFNKAVADEQDKVAKVGRELQLNFDTINKKYETELKSIGLGEEAKTLAEAINKIESDTNAAKAKADELHNAQTDFMKGKTQAQFDLDMSNIDAKAAKQKAAVKQILDDIARQKAASEDLASRISILTNSTLENLKLESKARIDALGSLPARIDAEQQLNAVIQKRAIILKAASLLSDDDKAKVVGAVEIAIVKAEELAKKGENISSAFDGAFNNLINGSTLARDQVHNLTKGLQGVGSQFETVDNQSTVTGNTLKRISDQSRTFSAGWSAAFNDYVTNASNAATAAAGIFNKFSSGLEDYFIDRLKGVQGGWKNFLKSLYEEIARSQIKQGLAKLFSGIGFGSLFSGGAAAGGLGGSRGQSPTSPLYTQEVSDKINQIKKDLGITGESMGKPSEGGGIWETIKTTISDFSSSVSSFLSSMFSGLGSFISNMTSGLGSILSSIGGTLFDVIGSIGGTLFDIIGSLGSGLGDILGGLMGGGGGGGGFWGTLFDVGMSLFGFANGGVIPNNKPVIVGERGPELLYNAGGMGVRSNEDSFGGGPTNITYNINAVDAMSFKQMIAQDPTFLYAVTMQGAKGMPLGR